MANFVYKKATATTLKACGYIDTERGTIDIDGKEKTLLPLLSDFNGACVELTVKIKSEEDIEAPTEHTSENNNDED